MIAAILAIFMIIASSYVNAMELTNEMVLEGVTNCETQCSNILAGVATAGEQACLRGCTYCLDNERFRRPTNECYKYCKTQNWSKQGICKDSIEPDKACMLGCMISLCQGSNFCVGCDVDKGEKCCYAESFTYNKKTYPGCESPTKTFPVALQCSQCMPNCELYPTEAQCN